MAVLVIFISFLIAVILGTASKIVAISQKQNIQMNFILFICVFKKCISKEYFKSIFNDQNSKLLLRYLNHVMRNFYLLQKNTGLSSVEEISKTEIKKESIIIPELILNENIVEVGMEI